MAIISDLISEQAVNIGSLTEPVECAALTAGGQIDITPLSNEEYFWNELAERLAGGE